MKLITSLSGFFLIVILSLECSVSLFAQVEEDWSVRYNGPGSGTDKSNAIAVDYLGNVYVTGSSTSSGVGTEDYLTIKYNSAGVEQWVKRVNGSAGSVDIAYAIAIDTSGDVIVTGGSIGTGSNYDYFTIKYSSSGDTLWTRRYNGPKNSKDISYAIALDDSGNIYITGESEGTVGTHGIFEDYATIKYNSDGVLRWVARYNGPAGDYDKANYICVDNESNIYITGVSDGGSSGSGEPHFDYSTIKYSTAGLTQWIRRYNGSANGEDEGVMVKADLLGNIFVTGFSTNSTSSKDYATICYSAEGDTNWIAIYDGPVSSDDRASSLAYDDEGNVFVTGKSYGGSAVDYDIATIKYDIFGDTTWVKRYNGDASSSDGGNKIVTDKLGNAYVTGYTTNLITASDYTTIKYSSTGTLSWNINYTNSGSAGSSEEPYGLCVDTSLNVYVTGVSALDYATIKYSPEPTSINDPGNPLTKFVLNQNYPNPFNPSTTIRYSIPEASFATIKVYDVLGNEVATLVNEEKPIGSYEVEFDAKGLSSGIYFYTINAGSFVETKKMILLR